MKGTLETPRNSKQEMIEALTSLEIPYGEHQGVKETLEIPRRFQTGGCHTELRPCCWRGRQTDYGNSYEEITIQSPREVDHFFPRVPCNLCTKHVIKGVMKGKLPS